MLVTHTLGSPIATNLLEAAEAWGLPQARAYKLGSSLQEIKNIAKAE